ncbi:helicase associated domain-containing protein, partial [Actinacidiphila sp. bgisy167]|uniref:helicase associated domain-containing protein n=1 Tax=Actinacidiphila sp. bgisy167 TaxID=3413797 RepID=UPI003D754DD2
EPVTGDEQDRLATEASHLSPRDRAGLVTAWRQTGTHTTQWPDNLMAWQQDPQPTPWQANPQPTPWQADPDTQMKLQAAEQFHKREGHLDVPSHWKELVDGEYISLGDWISNIRRKHTEVNGDTREKLDKLRMRWGNIRNTDTQMKLQAAEQFRKREGHLEVPFRHREPVGGKKINLGHWISNVRTGNTVDDDTRAVLDRLGMRWDKICKPIDIQLRLQAAEQFYKREGDLKVPSGWKEPVGGENVPLANWFADLRSGRAKVDDNTRAVLDGMGMQW